jgi:hypothetical protein
MNFSGLRYDNDTYLTTLKQSIGPGSYQIERPRNNCDECSFYGGGGPFLDRSGDALCDKELIDVDSELLNITRKASDCPSKKYIPSKDPFCKKNMDARKKECSFLVPEYTLISNGKCTGKETTINRWEWLCTSPQDRCIIEYDYNIDTKIITKDGHRVCIDNPLDQTLALPPKCNQFIKYDWAQKYNRPSNDLPNHQLSYCGNIPLL